MSTIADSLPRRTRRRGPLNICTSCGKVNPPWQDECVVCATALTEMETQRSAAQPLPAAAPPEPLTSPPVTASPQPSRAPGPRPRPAPKPMRTSLAPSQASADPFRRRRLTAVTGLLLSAALVLVVVVVALRPSASTTHSALAAKPSPAAQRASRPAGSRVAAPGKAAVPPRHQPPQPRTTAGASQPLTSVDSYWKAINRHDFTAAYGQLAPGALSLNEADFVDYEEQIGVETVQFAGYVLSRTGRRATIGVRSLVTEDRQLGCRSWAGRYLVREQAGRWLIMRAELGSGRCVTPARRADAAGASHA